MKKISEFFSENFQFLEVKFSIYLNRRDFVMDLKFNMRDRLLRFRHISESRSFFIVFIYLFIFLLLFIYLFIFCMAL